MENPTELNIDFQQMKDPIILPLSVDHVLHDSQHHQQSITFTPLPPQQMIDHQYLPMIRCPQCNISLCGYQSDLDQHINRVHNYKGIDFNHWSKHSSINEETNIKRQFHCSKCPKWFINRTKLREHYIVHTDAKDFKCHICMKQYKWDSSLRNHLRLVHMGVPKQFQCKKCTQFFNQMSTLKKHEWTHRADEQQQKTLETIEQTSPSTSSSIIPSYDSTMASTTAINDYRSTWSNDPNSTSSSFSFSSIFSDDFHF